MAEALGLAASVIAVVDMTCKVGSASLKLAGLWREVKEVPSMLLEKAERIKDLEEFLDDTESQIAKSQLPEIVCNMARLQKHIPKARSALTNVQEMVDLLQVKVNADRHGFKRRFASTKVLLRKDEWNALDRSLDSALHLLSIAQTQYLMAMSTFCTTVLLEQQPRSPQTPGQSCIGNGYSFETVERKENSIRKRKYNHAHSPVANFFHMPYSNSFLPTFHFGFGANSSFQFSVLAPTWLGGSVYSILTQRSIQGWQLNLRSYEMIERFPRELYGCLSMDDYLGFFRCLHENGITLHARDRSGTALLWLAVMFGALKTTRGILERGLDGTISEPLRSEHSTPYLFYLISLLNVHESGPGDLQFFELCADHGLDDVLDHTETILVLLRNGVSFSAFHAFLKRNGFCYDSLPIETRLQHLRELSESDRSWNPDEVKQIIPEIFELTAEIIELSLDEGCALIHSVALLFSRRLTTWISPLGGDQRLEEEKKQWSKLIGSCIRQDPASLHRLESVCSRNNGYSEASPFSFILWSFFGTKHYSYLSLDSERHVMPPMQLLLESALTAWITTLSNCGIDLLSYGRQEKRLYDEGSTRYRRQFIPWDYSSVTSRLLLIGFTYGSRPEQWKLWWTWEYEDYAGEFWDLVESQRFKMPGSWVDEPWDCDDFVLEERRRQDIWEMEQNTPLIWSEYRKIRPPS